MVHRLYPDFVAWYNERVLEPNHERLHYTFALDEGERLNFSNGLSMDETGVYTSDQRCLIAWDGIVDHYSGLVHFLVDIPVFHDLIRLFHIPRVIGG
jgi:hypothetical protein